MTEGTARYDAIALVEATERLGASIHADAGWDATSVSLDVPAPRLEPALELLAEVVLHPTFPEGEVERLRDERLNDLLQAKADPRRRADEVFAATIYEGSSPYHRPAGGTRETVAELTPARLRAAYERGHRSGTGPRSSSAATCAGIDVRGIVERLLGGWGPAVGAVDQRPDRRRRRGPRAVRPHRPPAGRGPDRDPDRACRRAAPDRRLPRAVGHGRDPRRAVQLAAEHEAARGEGLHLRRRRRLRPPPRGRSVQRPRRGEHRGHGARRRRLRGRARPDPRRAGHAGGAGGRPRLPRRRLPAPVRDARPDRRRAVRAGRPRAARRRARPLPAGDRGGDRRGRAGRGHAPDRPDADGDRARRRRRRVPRRDRGGRLRAGRRRARRGAGRRGSRATRRGFRAARRRRPGGPDRGRRVARRAGWRRCRRRGDRRTHAHGGAPTPPEPTLADAHPEGRPRRAASATPPAATPAAPHRAPGSRRACRRSLRRSIAGSSSRRSSAASATGCRRRPRAGSSSA